MAYFYKEILSNDARLENGRVAQFEPIGDDNGILQTEDEDTINSLRKLIQRRVGGVMEIQKDKYEEYAKKKDATKQQSGRRLSDPPEFQALRPNQDQMRAVGAGAAGAKPGKVFAFGGPAKDPAPEVQGTKPSAPKEDSPAPPPPVRPSPKKVPPKTSGPEGNLFT